MKHLLNFRNFTVLMTLTLLIACHENDVVDPGPDPENGPQYAGTYKGKEYKTTKVGIGNYWFEHDTVPMNIEVVEWNDKVIVEGDTFQLDANNEFRAPQFTLIIRNDSLYRSKIVQSVTICNYYGKRE